jgi:hypothetical protein
LCGVHEDSGGGFVHGLAFVEHGVDEQTRGEDALV